MSERASISALVADHGKWLMAFLRGLVGDVAEAEDAFQETWVRVMRSFGARPAAAVGADPRASRAYLVKTARSVVIDRFRRKRPTESLDALRESDDGGLVGTDLPDASPGPGERYESKATADDVRRAIAALPLKWRQVVLMRIEAEMEFKEIAAELGIPLGTALTWMHKATEDLKARLGGSR